MKKKYPKWWNLKRPTLGRLRPRLMSKSDRQRYDVMERALALQTICVEHANASLKNIEAHADSHDLAVSRCHFPLSDTKSGIMSKKSRSLYEYLAWYARDRELI